MTMPARGCQDRWAGHVSMVMRALILGLIVTVALPAAAGAAGRPLVPQGNSGANQYVESIPTAGGQRPTSSVGANQTGSAGSSSTSSILTPSVRAALASQGHDGRQTAALARAYAPATGSRGRSRGGGVLTGGGSSGAGSAGARAPTGAAAPAAGTSAGAGSSPSALLVRSVTGFGGQGGLGPGLSAVLLLSALGAGVLAVLRRRRAAD
jgi:hypothetical protein